MSRSTTSRANSAQRVNLIDEVRNNLATTFDDAHRGNAEARSLPVVVGDVFTFTLSDALFMQRDEQIGGEHRAWVDLVADDDTHISATQITRRNNGLDLEGNTILERIDSFVQQFDEDTHQITLRIAQIRQRQFENGVSNYYIFEVVEGE